jgi:hypothetical protein
MEHNDQRFQKALLLLDCGEAARGEALLREILATSDTSADRALLASVRCCLGRLMVESDRPREAIAFLKPVADLDEYDDLVAHERQEARELLRSLAPTE